MIFCVWVFFWGGVGGGGDKVGGFNLGCDHTYVFGSMGMLPQEIHEFWRSILIQRGEGAGAFGTLPLIPLDRVLSIAS